MDIVSYLIVVSVQVSDQAEKSDDAGQRCCEIWWRLLWLYPPYFKIR